MQIDYREHILTGKCGGKKSSDGDGDEEASVLERWQNVEALMDMAAQHSGRPLWPDLPHLDSEVCSLRSSAHSFARQFANWTHGVRLWLLPLVCPDVLKFGSGN